MSLHLQIWQEQVDTFFPLINSKVFFSRELNFDVPFSQIKLRNFLILVLIHNQR